MLLRKLKFPSGGAGLILVLVSFVINTTGGAETSAKDITYARPKHHRYPSYKSYVNSSSSSDEDSREHLSSETQRNQQTHQPPPTSNSTTPASARDPKSAKQPANPSSATLKRSLPTDHHKSPSAVPRFGGGGGGGPISIQKTPPDLQFGLAFTVPFVSLSTDKLINTFAGKSHHGGGNDVSSILKLNVKGLIVAAVVGIAAVLFLPGLLGGGGILPGLLGHGGGGWGGGSLLDSILPHVASFLPGLSEHLNPHGGGGGGGPYASGGWDGDNPHVSRPFGYQDYYEYNGVHNHNRMDEQGLLRDKTARREARSGKNGTTPGVPNAERLLQAFVSTVTSTAKKYISKAEECLHLQVCQKAVEKVKPKKDGGKKGRESGGGEDDPDLIEFIESLTNNELVKGSPMSEGVKKAHEYGKTKGKCDPYEKAQCSLSL